MKIELLEDRRLLSGAGYSPGRTLAAVTPVDVYPFFEDFEDGAAGTLGDHWTVRTQGTGSVNLLSSGAPRGAYHVELNNGDDPYLAQGMALLHLDLLEDNGNALTGVTLDFWAKSSDGGGAGSVHLGASEGGVEWGYPVPGMAGVLPLSAEYRHFTINLDQALSDTNSAYNTNWTYTDDFRVGFYSSAYAHLAPVYVDDVRVMVTAAAPTLFGPKVIGQSPAGLVNDRPALNSIQLTFDKAIDPTTFAAEDVLLKNPQGEQIAPVFVAPVDGSNNTRFDVTFADQSRGGSYRLTVGPRITDTYGNPMNQNGDGFNGDNGLPGFIDPDSYAGTVSFVPMSGGTSVISYPFVEDFEAGSVDALGAFWTFDTQGTGTVIATANGGPRDTYHLLLSHGDAYSSSESAVLHLNLLENAVPRTGVTLDFWAKGESEWGGYMTVRLRTNESSSWTDVPFGLGAFSLALDYRHSTIDLDEALRVTNAADPNANLAYSDDFQVSFYHSRYASYEPLYLDDVRVRVTGEDVVGPMIAAQVPMGVITDRGSLNTITLTFSEPVDPRTFTAQDVVLRTPESSPVAPLLVMPVAGAGDTQFILMFEDQSLGGDYLLAVGPQIADLSGNLMSQEGKGVRGNTGAYYDRYLAMLTLVPNVEAKTLLLSIDSHAIADTSPPGETTAMVTRNNADDLTSDLIVSLYSSHSAEAIVPSSVTIPAGAASASFDITAVADGVVDGVHAVAITAEAPSYKSSIGTLFVEDSDGPKLTIDIPREVVGEEVGGSVAVATLARDGDTSTAVDVHLTRTGDGRILLPAIVTIPIGESSVEFNVDVVNDHIIAGTEVAAIMVYVADHSLLGASDTITVTDDDAIDRRTIGGRLAAHLPADTYHVLTDLKVDAGQTLEIDPGSQLRFSRDKGIQVDGVLTAQGTADSGIAFASDTATPAPGDWSGILVTNSGGPRTVLEYITVSEALRGVSIEPSASYPQVTLSHSEAHHNKEYGVLVYAGPRRAIGTDDVLVLDNRVHHNGSAGIALGARAVGGIGGAVNTATISGNEVFENTGAGIDVWASHYFPFGFWTVYSSWASPTVTRNVVRDNLSSGIVGYAGGGGYGSSSLGGVFANNLVTGNKGDGVQLRVGYNGDLTTNVVNNTIAQNSAAGVYQQETAAPLVWNNIVVGNARGIEADAPFVPTSGAIGYNDVYGNYDGEHARNWVNYPSQFGIAIQRNANGTPADVEWNISEDPRFVRAGDCQVRVTSPVVNAGTSSDAPADDRHGVLRDALPDIGCHEVVGFYWDRQGDGQWGDAARWVSADGQGRNGFPAASMDAVVGANTVTVENSDLAREGSTILLADSARVQVQGNFRMDDDAEYACELGGAANGQILVTAGAELNGTLSLKVAARSVSPLQFVDQARTIVAAAGGVQGRFEHVPQVSAHNAGSEPVAGHLGYGVFLTDRGPHGQGVAYQPNAVVVDIFQAIAGDTDGDRDVDAADIQRILRANKFNSGKPADWTEGDFSGDGLVTAVDIQLVLQANKFNKGDYTAVALPGKGLAAEAGRLAKERAQAVDAVFQQGVKGTVPFSLRENRDSPQRKSVAAVSAKLEWLDWWEPEKMRRQAAKGGRS